VVGGHLPPLKSDAAIPLIEKQQGVKDDNDDDGFSLVGPKGTKQLGITDITKSGRGYMLHMGKPKRR
jgi:hypothetical protein